MTPATLHNIQVQALVFDFDGVILDTETPELRVWTEIFHEHGVEMPPDYWTNVIGRGAEQAIERPWALLSRLNPAYVETPETAARRRERILDLIKLESPRTGIEALVSEAEKAGLLYGIASSSKHVWVDGHLQRLGLLQRFSVIVCADDVTRAKPFPDLYMLACKRLGANPAHSVAIEDSPNGIAAAKAAEMFAVAFPNSVTATLDLSQADVVLPSLEGVSLGDLSVLMKR